MAERVPWAGSLSFIVPHDPVPQPRPRFTAVGGHPRPYTPSDHPIHAFRAAVRLAARLALAGRGPTDKPLQSCMRFRIPRTKEMMRKCVPDGEIPHTSSSRLDVENLAKGALDSLGPFHPHGKKRSPETALVFRDDSQVWWLRTVKVWAPKGSDGSVTIRFALDEDEVF